MRRGQILAPATLLDRRELTALECSPSCNSLFAANWCFGTWSFILLGKTRHFFQHLLVVVSDSQQYVPPVFLIPCLSLPYICALTQTATSSLLSSAHSSHRSSCGHWSFPAGLSQWLVPHVKPCCRVRRHRGVSLPCLSPPLHRCCALTS